MQIGGTGPVGELPEALAGTMGAAVGAVLEVACGNGPLGRALALALACGACALPSLGGSADAALDPLALGSRAECGTLVGSLSSLALADGALASTFERLPWRTK